MEIIFATVGAHRMRPQFTGKIDHPTIAPRSPHVQTNLSTIAIKPWGTDRWVGVDLGGRMRCAPTDQF